MVDLWTIVLSGPPTSGKTFLAKRLLLTLPNSVRINPDELRLMMFNDASPTCDEDLIYCVVARMRDIAIDYSHSVVVDSTAPNVETREYLLGGEARTTNKLLVVMDVSKSVLSARARTSGKLEILKMYEKAWQEPSGHFPVFKFRNDDEEQFETSFYLLGEYLSHEHVQHNSVFRNMLRFRKNSAKNSQPESSIPTSSLSELVDNKIRVRRRQ